MIIDLLFLPSWFEKYDAMLPGLLSYAEEKEEEEEEQTAFTLSLRKIFKLKKWNF